MVLTSFWVRAAPESSSKYTTKAYTINGTRTVYSNNKSALGSRAHQLLQVAHAVDTHSSSRCWFQGLRSSFQTLQVDVPIK